MKYYVRRKTCKLKTNYIYHKMYTCFFLNSRPRKKYPYCLCRRHRPSHLLNLLYREPTHDSKQTSYYIHVLLYKSQGCLYHVTLCTNDVAKTKALISLAVTVELICVFIFAYAKSWFSHKEVHLFNYHFKGISLKC